MAKKLNKGGDATYANAQRKDFGLRKNRRKKRRQVKPKDLQREYATALFITWVGLMRSDVAVLTTYGVAYFPGIVTRGGLLLLGTSAIACLIIASYRLWLKERR